MLIGIAANVGMTRLRHSHSETDAEVVAVRSGGIRGFHRATFRYTVDGVVFRGSSFYSTRDLYVGKQVTIYYNPNHPGGTIMRTGWGSSGGFPVLHGGFVFVYGVFFACYAAYLLVGLHASRRLGRNKHAYLQFSKSLKHEAEKMRNAYRPKKEKRNGKSE